MRYEDGLGYKIVAIAMFTILLDGCSTPEKEVMDGPIRVGGTFALSGSLARIGQAEQNGILLAIEEVNEKGGVAGRRLELISDDNKGEAVPAVTSVQKMIDVDRADVIFSAFTHVTQAIAPVTNASGKVLIYHSTVPDIARKYRFTFRDYYEMTDNGILLARLAGARGHTNVAYIGEASESCLRLFESFKAEGKIVGTGVSANEEFNPDETDFRGMLLKAKEAKPDAIFFCAWRSEENVMRQLKEVGMVNTPTYHIDARKVPLSTEADEVFIENKAVSTSYGLADEVEDRAVASFIERYEKRFGSRPKPDALYAYDDMMFLAKAIGSCGAPEAACIDRLMKGSCFDGISERVCFHEDGVSTRKTILLQREKDGWSEVKT
ncbi:MAG: ABC transporter substrate-binding protein [Nanoarchaeota archaeon]